MQATATVRVTIDGATVEVPAELDVLVTQDIFLTETAEFADVILPATSYFEKDGTYTNIDDRGEIELEAQSDPSAEPGSLFIPLHVREVAANLLTTGVLDPDGKIPEFKYCAVRMEAV